MGRLLRLLRKRSGGAGASPYLLRDTFTDADGTPLESHTMDVGGGWEIPFGGIFEVDCNKAIKTADESSHQWAVADAGSADGTLTAVLNGPGPGAGPISYPSVCARFAAADTFWGVQVTPLDPQSLVILYERSVAGGYVQRGVAAVGPLLDTPFTIRLTMSGADVSVSIDGDEVITYGSADGSGTKWGLWFYSLSAACDTFEVAPP